MAALHVTVVSPSDAKVIVKGAARSLTDAYLYSNEVQAIADVYPRRPSITVAELAADLDGAIYNKLHASFTEKDLGSALLRVIRKQARSNSVAALLPQLIWQLGLHRKVLPQNLDKTIPTSAIRFDPVQAWLIGADFTLPLIYAHPAPRLVVNHLAAETGNIVKQVAGPSSGLCDRLEPSRQQIEDSGEILKQTIELIGETFPEIVQATLKFVGPLIDEFHGIAVGLSIVTFHFVTPHETKLGGGPIVFLMGVTMWAKLPDRFIKCGWLSGDEFPAEGGIPGVKVSWVNADLLPWGSVKCGTCNYTETDGPYKGTARETFTPKVEPYPHGQPTFTVGSVGASAYVLKSLGNKLGGIVEGNGNFQAMAFTIDYNTDYPTSFSASMTITNDVNWEADKVTSSGPLTVPKNSDYLYAGDPSAYYATNMTGTIVDNANACGSGTYPITSSETDIGLVPGYQYAFGDVQWHTSCGSGSDGFAFKVLNASNKIWSPGQSTTKLSIVDPNSSSNPKAVIGTLTLNWYYSKS